MISFVLLKLKNYKGMIPVILIMTGLTLVFIYIFGVGFSQKYIPKVSLIDLDGSKTSLMIKEGLKDMPGFEFIEQEENEDQEEMVIRIEEGFERRLRKGDGGITFYKTGSAIEHITLENEINELINEFLTDEKDSKDLSALYRGQGIQASENEIFDQLQRSKKDYVTYTLKGDFYQREEDVEYHVIKNYFAGFLLFFSMFIIMFGIGNIVEEKELMVWQRQLVSPLSKGTILMGNLISNFIVGMAQLIFVIIISKLLFDMDWGGSIFALISILGAYVLAGTAMGLFISGFVKTQQQLGAILPTIIVATSMIGGCMWPVEMMSSRFLRGFANFLPQKWAVDGIRDVIIYNANLKDVLPAILYTLLIAAILFLMSMLQNRKEV